MLPGIRKIKRDGSGAEAPPRKSGRGAKDEEMAAAGDGIRELMVNTAKLSLANATRGRVQDAIGMDSLLIDRKHPLVEVGKKAREEFIESVKGATEEQRTAAGEIHLRLWDAIIVFYNKDDTDTQLKKHITDHITAISKFPEEQRVEILGDLIKHVYIGKCHDAKKAKIFVSVKDSATPVWIAIRTQLIKDGAVLKRGPAPASNNERMVQKGLKALGIGAGYDPSAW
eukprot:TRINITY_DN19339_c0_g1_i1.p2 TRINITY_DN19339_c0_g1~~TRINITY_DN19339_c0_g1_i1.p2  ORF type:complete len:227 (+),score=65.63 TRINITY_DN19339_c0_g1_i1:301-981(+)